MHTGSTPWVFGPGTGVLGHIGPLRLPVAPISYAPLRRMVEQSVLQCMPLAGVGRLQPTYEWVEAQLLALAGGGKVNLVGHSQPASHYVRFAARNPSKVGTVVSIAGAHSGSRLADINWPLRLLAPCIKDLHSESEYLRGVKGEFEDMLAKTSEAERPRVICFASIRDGVVLPWHSSLLEGAENYVFSREMPGKLRGASWIETSRDCDHFSIIWVTDVLKKMYRVVHHQHELSPVENPALRLQVA